ncbi:hypothetical protein GPY51_22595 [Photorhabdus laumondii subsp. laumondii]|uniref:DUF551 domain-containing protein n=1 Tax=Photorhabdus laumondii subsp. laumondii TaxID=141679 RepID=A0A6L9JUY7_PHOLM|nr:MULTISPECIES: hypothetical protein [Photorhabdus]MCC8386153.1 hypothetical protein [Photorhabdus laumondii]MCC8388831.1 hypothetical protein [Photorhabdus laumondii]MCC8415300.1 hypothetical protein [Photorhabdus laumondii]MCZ1250618.1 hypothetical protein [Photorhabdus laumondii subsp. laumondii]NDK97147.1 hypothetical protein [Photorhabdus laumondii subsp. laumondii]
MSKINQTELAAAIVKEIARQDTNIEIEACQFIAIIKAANSVCGLFGNSVIEQQVIPWVSVNDRYPGDCGKLCLVRITYLSGLATNDYDWWDGDKREWMEHTNDEVTHWCYMDGIPAPTAEEKA